MGVFRLLLALAVLYSHVFGRVLGYNPGVFAVISFFVMSGYVMTLLLKAHYPRLSDCGWFYLDRAARLMPQFILYLVITVVLLWLTEHSTPMVEGFSAADIAWNASLIPTGFYMFRPDLSLYIPATWSLGLEATFYLVAPFVLALPVRWKWGFFTLSLLVAAVAFAGAINSDWYGYRLLPGTLYIFLAGSALASRPLPSRFFVTAFLFSLALFFLAMTDRSLGSLPYNTEVSAGVVFGLIAVLLLKEMPYKRFDHFLGNLSYGVFLNHFPILFMAEHYEISRIWIIPISICLALASYWLVERPALNWRRQLRLGRASDRSVPAAA